MLTIFEYFKSIIFTLNCFLLHDVQDAWPLKAEKDVLSKQPPIPSLTKVYIYVCSHLIWNTWKIDFWCEQSQLYNDVGYVLGSIIRGIDMM